MDYSLLLAASLQSFYEWKSGTQKGYFNPEIAPPVITSPAPESLAAKAPAAPAIATPQAVQKSAVTEPVRRVFQIRRGAEVDD